MTALHDRPATETPRRRRARGRTPLAFSVAGGPVVAVCGVAGGAGTTTLAWALAAGAARESSAAVLLAELPSAAGGITALTGIGGTRSLGRMLEATAGVPLAPANGPDGLGVVASGPEPTPELAAPELRRALEEVVATARVRHGLVVLDCGVLGTRDAQAAAALATHVLWTVPAGRAAAERARALLLDSTLAPAPGDALELLVVTATRPAPLPERGRRTLRAVAAERCERLVLIPHVRELAAGRLDPGSRRLATALAAIGGVLQQTNTNEGDIHGA